MFGHQRFKFKPVTAAVDAALAGPRFKSQELPLTVQTTTALTRLLPLGAMLAGMTFTSQGALAQTAPAVSETTLPTVNVRADSDKDGLRATTTRVGKVLQDPQDVPQAVTTVTRALMDEQQVGSLREAMRNVTGITFNAAEGGRSGDNMNLRSFYTFGDMYMDGIRDTAQYNRETFNLEQIDVLRGAGAMLFGRGQAGGVINQVSKTPLRTEEYAVTGSLGNYGYHEFTADLNTPINENTALRVNLMQREEGSWRYNPALGTQAAVNRNGIALSLALNQDSDSKVWLNYYDAKTNDNPDYGVAFNNATRAPTTLLPPSTFFNIDRNFDKSSTQLTTLVNEYTFSADSQLRTQLRYGDYDRSYWAKTPSATTPPNNLGGVGGNQTRASYYNTYTAQSDFSTKLQALGMKHEVLTGVEWLKEQGHRKALQNFGTVAAPAYYPYSEAVAGAPINFTGFSYAAYAQDTVEFIPNWKAMLGYRRDQLNANYSSTTSPSLYYGENSYRSAVSYQPNPATHYYITWSDSFSPTADLYQLTVAPLPPERSSVYEIGAKWMLLDNNLAFRTALYRAQKTWERNTDLEATAAILTKKRVTDGIEFELTGNITSKWEMFSGLTFMNPRIIEVAENVNAVTGAITYANPEYAFKRARNTPNYAFNMWSTYKIFEGWKVGGGVQVMGDRQAFNPSGAGPVPTLNGAYHPNTAPSFVRWDAMASYDQPKWAMRLNVKNLFDKIYYDAVYDNGAFTVPGNRRQAILTAELKF